MNIPSELQPLHTKITQCLDVINYRGDRDMYASQLLELAMQRATLRFVGAQPAEVRQKLSQTLSPETAGSLADHFSDVIESDQFLEVVNQECQHILTRWANTVLPLLNARQIAALKQQVSA